MSYILRHRGDSHPDEEVVKQVLRANNVSILDASSLPKMLLVDGIKDSHLAQIKQELQEWDFFPQKTSYKVPDTRPKVLNKTGK